MHHQTKVTKTKLLFDILIGCFLSLLMRAISNLIESLSLLRDFFGYVTIVHFIGTVVVYVKIYFVARKSIPRGGAKMRNKITPMPTQENNSTNEASTSRQFTTKSSPKLNKQRSDREEANENFVMKTNLIAVKSQKSGNLNKFEDENRLHKPSSSKLNPKCKNDGKRSRVSNLISKSSTMDALKLSEHNSLQVEICARKNLLHNIKLANSCRLVVIFSLLSFVTPTILVGLRPIDLGQHFIEVVVSCNLFFFSNSFLNGLIFFWRVGVLRNEAKIFLKKILFTILRKK